MNPIVLKNTTSSGELLEASFFPEKGMNMISFKKGNVEVMDQGTRELFEERYAGLGALIGPHFHHRKKETIPVIKDESLFPHIARIRAKNISEPFSHGIARYAPWKFEATATRIRAEITGKDTWNGVPLAELEGQNFKMTYVAELTPTRLEIELSVVSDADSLVGLHYYYHLPNGKGTIKSRIQNTLLEQSIAKPIPQSWNFSEQHQLVLPLDQAIDNTFFPFPDPLEGRIYLETETYQLLTTYQCASQENSWQLYHPAGATFVCIEPLSAQDPRHPNLTVSSLRVQLQITTGIAQYEKL